MMRRNVGNGPAATPLRVSSPTPEQAQAQAQARVLVGDVLDFRLRNEDGWVWPGGWVVMKLHEAVFDGQSAYFVRTDASDESFAEQEKLVHVPKLGGALSNGDHAQLYLATNGTPEQRPVMSTAPGQPDFTPLFRISRVTWQGAPGVLTSHSQVSDEVAAGRLTLEPTGIVVNYPVVKWPGGELPVDPRLEKALDGGPLVSAPDLGEMTVKFKLHQCYPESYYIITDTGAPPMAEAMNVAAAPGVAALTKVGATEKIFVFGNGVPGFAAMGFQPSIFASKAGEPAWSPMWEHVTAMWKDERRLASETRPGR